MKSNRKHPTLSRGTLHKMGEAMRQELKPVTTPNPALERQLDKLREVETKQRKPRDAE